MRLKDVIVENPRMDEIAPIIGAIAGGAARAAGAIGGAALKGGAALARGVGSAVSQGANAVGSAVSQGANAVGSAVGQTAAGLAGGAMDPAQAAQAAKERTEQKKAVQDQIKQTEQQLIDLRKKLAELG
jgi:cell shape-determining protein MreC